METARFSSPHEGVFLKKFGKKNSPLFSNQIDLAGAIINNKESGFKDKSLPTVRSAISQVFSGERNLSKSLRYALFETIKLRFDLKRYNFQSFEETLIEKFNEAYNLRIRDKRDRIGDRDYNELVAATEKGKEILITTLEPAELHQSQLADHLKNQLLQKTKILDDSNNNGEPTTYKFYLSNEEGGLVARVFWEALKSHILDITNLTIEEVDKKLKNANKKRIIQTILIPIEVAMHPYVFINYNNINEARGFFVSYRDIHTPSVAELSLKLVSKLFIYLKPKLEEFEKDKKNHFIIY